MGILSNFFEYEEKLIAPRDLATSRAQSITDLGSGSDIVGQAAISASTDSMRTVYRVDYSDYSNFVFFNSAVDYFNISGEKILNEYPQFGTFADQMMFISGCDDYQRWLVQQSWPASIGNNGGYPGYVQDPELFMSPGTSSFTIEFAVPNISSSTTLVEKLGPSGSGFSIWNESSTTGTIYFRLFYNSGTSITLRYNADPSEIYTTPTRYLSFIVDQVAGSASIVHCPNVDVLSSSMYVSGFLNSYYQDVKIVASASLATIPSVDTSGTWMTIASGTHGSSGTLAHLSYWSRARTLDEISVSYVGNVYAQDNLEMLLKFNQVVYSGSMYLVQDAAGNSLNCVQVGPPSVSVFGGIDGIILVDNSASLLNFSQLPELVTAFNQVGNLAGVLENYVGGAQQSGTVYDRGNTNIITRMVPEAYLQLEQEIGTDVLQDFLYIIARQFDQLKVAIDQFVNWNKSNYVGFNDTPDVLLKDAANYYGWDFVGNFLNQDAIRYFFGKNVVPGVDLETKLYEIKNEFWRRTLNELMYIYKTKGTRESVEALIRVYGMDQKLVRLKEYGVKPYGQIETNRVQSHRSLPAYQIRDGIHENIISYPMSGFDGFTLSLHARFPYTTGTITGTIATVGPIELRYSATSGSSSGSIQFASGSEIYASGSFSFIGGQWWNVFVTAPPTASGGWPSSIYMQQLDQDQIIGAMYFTGSSRSVLANTASFNLGIGHVNSSGGLYYVNEVKLYNNYQLSQVEMDAQTLDFQSYGTLNIDNLANALQLHWRLDDDFTIPSGVLPSSYGVFDFSGNGISGTVSSPTMSSLYKPFVRFLFDYNFIAPVEYGWNDEKIRIYDSNVVPQQEHFSEVNALALEINLVDALNEDISKILASISNWNNIIGVPANRYRDSYFDLQKYRSYYFKKLLGRINFREFADIMDFFDKSFVLMVQRLLPARAVFYGEEFVIESHMLERAKIQWAYRRYSPPLEPEGVIIMVDRSGTVNAAGGTAPTGLYYA